MPFYPVGRNSCKPLPAVPAASPAAILGLNMFKYMGNMMASTGCGAFHEIPLNWPHNRNTLAHPRPKAVTRLRSPAYSSPPPCARHTRLPSLYPRYQSFHIDISNASRTQVSRRTPCPRATGATSHHRTKLMPLLPRRLRPALPPTPRPTSYRTLSSTLYYIISLESAYSGGIRGYGGATGMRWRTPVLKQ